MQLLVLLYDCSYSIVAFDDTDCHLSLCIPNMKSLLADNSICYYPRFIMLPAPLGLASLN